MPQTAAQRAYNGRRTAKRRADSGQVDKPPVHLWIPDTQIKKGVPNDHLQWIGEYAADYKPDVIVHAGDHWDMPSLSSYDRKGGVKMEGRRYWQDIDAGNRGWELLDGPIQREINRTAETGNPWKPRKIRLRGNHEDRVTRAIEMDAQLQGLLSLDHMQSPGWEVIEFLVPITVDGMTYSHYFYNPMSGRPYSGENLKLRLKTLGFAFCMGHQQTYDHAVRYVNGQKQVGIVAGACYQHDEDYKGPQGNAHWRGVVMLHEVENGSCDVMEVSLD